MQDDKRDYKSEDLRSFGRIRARKRSARQQRLLDELLSQYAIDLRDVEQGNLNLFFFPPPKDLWMEIGFGSAEHLIEQSKLYPDIGFIGSEPFEGGILKALSAIEIGNIQNVRLHNADVRPLLRILPKSSLGRIFIFFPDPWPKARHTKRRLFNPEFVNIVADVLKPGAELRVATDIRSYAEDIFEICSGHPSFVRQGWREDLFENPWPDWPGTRYQRKALKEGRTPLYLTFCRAVADG